MFAAASLLATLIGLALARPAARDSAVHESIDNVPNGFVNVGPAPADTTLNLRVALVQSDTKGLHDTVYAVSDPSSASYGKHLSKEEVEKFVAPPVEHVTVVNEWFMFNGINATTLSPAGDWMGFSTSVQQANELFSADFYVYNHTESGTQSIRTMSYSLPASLKGKVDFVHPTVALGVLGFLEQYVGISDVQTFLRAFDSSSPLNLDVQSIGDDPSLMSHNGVGQEANLDVEYTAGLAHGVPLEYISVVNSVTSKDTPEYHNSWLDMANAVLAQPSPPQVLSISYGDDESGFPQALANNICNVFAQLGARGVSILVASGDGGVSGIYSNPSCRKFEPVFPATCPFVTSVGGTTEFEYSLAHAASLSSGGFSNYFSRPAYQDAAVVPFLQNVESNPYYAATVAGGWYNATGRGFPDISAQAVKAQIVYNGQVSTVEGTSFSTPIMASIIALLNDELMSAGRPPLGFLNPWIYTNGSSAFTDISDGSNGDCGMPGFLAAPGWDAISGFGTPVYGKLRSVLGL